MAAKESLSETERVLKDVLSYEGKRKPTEKQKIAFESIIDGKDLVGNSTGSGNYSASSPGNCGACSNEKQHDFCRASFPFLPSTS